MSALFCVCGNGSTNGNTGIRGAQELKRAALYILVATVADDGTKNVILESDFVNGVLPDSFIQEKLNHVDPSKRWYPVTDLRSITNLRADPEAQTFDPGQNSELVYEGIRPVTASARNKNAKWKKNIDRLICEYGLSFFEVDECGSIGGETAKNDETVFEPHPIAKKTFYANLLKAQGGEGSAVNIQFEYDQKSVDANECIILDDNIETDMLEVDGLLNLLSTVSNITSTSFDVALTLEYGGFASREAQTGLLAADFTLENLTTASTVVISSVTESAVTPGSYAFVIPAQTAADILDLQISSTGNKYDKEGFELVQTRITAV